MAKLPHIDDDKQNQLMQALLEAIPGMMFHVKRDGTFLEFFSSKVSQPLFPPEEFLGKTVSDIMPPEIAKRQMLKIEQLFTSGEPQKDQYPLVISGEMHWYEIRFTVSGEDTLVAVVRDITERIKAEEALRISESRFRSLIEQSPFSIVIYRPDGHLIFGNEAAKRLFDISREEYNYLIDNYNILTDRQLEANGLMPYIKKGFAGEATASPPSEYHGERENDTKEVLKDSIWTEGAIYPIKDDRGHVREVVIIHNDITERKKAEEVLIETKEQLKALLEASPAVIYKCDPGNGYPATFISENVERQLGYTPQQFTEDRQFWASHIHPEDRPRIFAELSNLFKTDHHIHEYRFLHQDGTYHWMLDQLRLIRDDKDNPLYIIGNWVDITELKEAEEELNQRARELTAINLLAQRVSSSLSVKQVTEEALQAVADAVNPDLVMLFLRQGQLLTLQGFGPINTTYHCEETPVHVVGECLCGLAIKGEKPIFSIDIHNDSRCTWTECKKAGLRSFAALPLRIGDNVIGVLGVACATTRDFEQQAPFLQTLSNELAIGLQNALFYEELQRYADKLEQRVAKRTVQLEEKTKELEQANSRLKRADQLKSVFLASMSHELRTPLNSIIGFTGILLMELAGKLNTEQKKQLNLVKNSANHLLNMINDILDISKIEAGRVDLSPEKFLLDDVINEVAEIFSNQAAQKGLELIVNIPEKIFLFSDMRRIKQILINLVSNAVKFTNQGRITVTGTILPDERIEISVADTGIGIKEESMDKLFNPFQQVDMNLTKQFEGTGLGLYLCKSLVNLLGGEISAKSEYKKGSVFTFILPLQYKKEK